MSPPPLHKSLLCTDGALRVHPCRGVSLTFRSGF